MARDVLTTPLSTVASESAFNVGGRVLDAFYSSLKPKIVQAVICLRDWSFGQEGDGSYLIILYKSYTCRLLLCFSNSVFISFVLLFKLALMPAQCKLDELCGDAIKFNYDNEEGEVVSKEERTSTGTAGSGTKQKSSLLV